MGPFSGSLAAIISGDDNQQLNQREAWLVSTAWKAGGSQVIKLG
jgi:hypothetical protein